MRPIIHTLIFGLLLISSCEEKEPDIVCTTNTTTADKDGKKSCGISKIQGYSKSGNEETLNLQVAGGFEIIMYSVSGFQDGASYAPYSLSMPNLSSHISNSITVVKFDRTAKKVTLKFRFENEISVGVNGTTVVVHDGQATDLEYR